jgi:hypothetical protein
MTLRFLSGLLLLTRQWQHAMSEIPLGLFHEDIYNWREYCMFQLFVHPWTLAGASDSVLYRMQWPTRGLEFAPLPQLFFV